MNPPAATQRAVEKSAFLERLAQGRPLLLDGAMGTALIARGLDRSRQRAPEWSIERPEEVLAVHRAHVAAGAELVLTNTFLQPSAAECAASLRLARESGARFVGGSLYAGLVDLARCVRALAGADVIWLETATSVEQAERAAKVARGETSLPVVVTLAAGASGDARAFEQAKRASLPPGSLLRGFNCGPWTSVPLARVLKLDAAGRDPAEWARLLARSGAQLVGGCCGATPAHIAALARELSERDRA